MTPPLINILIRTHRPHLLPVCVQSVVDSGYSNWRVFCIADNLDAWRESIRQNLRKEDGCYTMGEKFTAFDYKPMPPDIPFHYNLYCNTLIRRPLGGYNLFLDDDDRLIPGALSKIAEHLTNPDQPVICQMIREARPKPADIYMDKKAIVRGRIGMPCMILHSKWKDAYTFEAVEDADYKWIKAITDILKPKFVKIPVVDAGSRSHGK